MLGAVLLPKRESEWEEDNGLVGWLVECRYSEEHKHKEPVD